MQKKRHEKKKSLEKCPVFKRPISRAASSGPTTIRRESVPDEALGSVQSIPTNRKVDMDYISNLAISTKPK